MENLLKDEYRQETNNDVYSDDGRGYYCDKYVKWLETKLNNLIKHHVSGSLPKAKCECKQNALPYKAEAYIDRCSRCGNDR